MTPRPRPAARAAALRLAAVATTLALAGCSPSSPTAPSTPTATVAAGAAPGVVAPLVLPATEPGPAPLVVLVPGGGWRSADPSGLAGLADAVAAEGATAALVSYRTATDGAFFPVPASDVACAVAQAAAEATEAGYPPSEVVVLGHSAGAQLAAVVALDPAVAPSSGCPYPPVAADRLVGLAGPYDVVAAADVAVDLFGPDRPDPSTWAEGNPLPMADRRAELPVLLLHGSDDVTVPVEFSTAFAEALEAGGHDVTVRVVEGADHQTIYTAAVAGAAVTTWLGLPAAEPSP